MTPVPRRVLSTIGMLALSCGGIPGSPQPKDRWAQCPPPGVVLEPCVFENDRGSAIGLGSGSFATLADTDALCASPCTEVSHLDLNLVEGERLEDMPLRKLTKVRELSVRGVTPIRSLEGLPAELVVERLTVHNAPGLVSLAGLPTKHLRAVTINSAAVFEDLSGLEGAVELDELSVTFNPKLKRVHGAKSLLRAPLDFSGNNALESISGFANLVEGTPGVAVRNHRALTSLTGFDRLALGGLTVEDNPLLPRCYAEAIAARLPEDSYVSIFGNHGTGECP